MRKRRRRKSGEDATVVLGVVGPLGAGGAHHAPETEWTLEFALKPWRQVDGEVDERELSVSRKVSEDELKEYMRLIQSYDVVRARVRFDEELSATLIEFLGADDSDEELTRRAAELQQPVTTEVDFFGTLTLDRQLDWWETEQVWDGTPVRLSISPDEDGDLEAVAKTAEALWSSQSDWDQRLRTRAIDDLLELKNEGWREDDEAEVTPQEFAQRMKLESVTAYSEGEFEFWFEDDDLFLGHSIRVSGNLTDGPTDAEIEG
jgi:hypothetical protein